MGRLSSGKAAEACGLGRAEFLFAAGRLGASLIQFILLTDSLDSNPRTVDSVQERDGLAPSLAGSGQKKRIGLGHYGVRRDELPSLGGAALEDPPRLLVMGVVHHSRAKKPPVSTKTRFNRGPRRYRRGGRTCSRTRRWRRREPCPPGREVTHNPDRDGLVGAPRRKA